MSSKKTTNRSKGERGAYLNDFQYEVLLEYIRTGLVPANDVLKQAVAYDKDEDAEPGNKFMDKLKARLRSWSSRLKYREEDGNLIHGLSNKIVLSQEKYIPVIEGIHRSSLNHLSFVATLEEVSKDYCIGKRTFGLNDELVKRVLQECKYAKCSRKEKIRAKYRDNTYTSRRDLTDLLLTKNQSTDVNPELELESLRATLGPEYQHVISDIFTISAAQSVSHPQYQRLQDESSHKEEGTDQPLLQSCPPESWLNTLNIYDASKCQEQKPILLVSSSGDKMKIGESITNTLQGHSSAVRTAGGNTDKISVENPSKKSRKRKLPPNESHTEQTNVGGIKSTKTTIAPPPLKKFHYYYPAILPKPSTDNASVLPPPPKLTYSEAAASSYGKKHPQEMSITKKHSQGMSITKKHSQEMSITKKHSQEMSINKKHSQEMSITKKHSQDMSIYVSSDSKNFVTANPSISGLMLDNFKTKIPTERSKLITSLCETRNPGRAEGELLCETGTPGRAEREPLCETRTPGRAEAEPFCESKTPGREEGEPLCETRTPGREEGEPLCETKTPGREEGEPLCETRTPGRAEGEQLCETRTPGRAEGEPLSANLQNNDGSGLRLLTTNFLSKESLSHSHLIYLHGARKDMPIAKMLPKSKMDESSVGLKDTDSLLSPYFLNSAFGEKARNIPNSLQNLENTNLENVPSMSTTAVTKLNTSQDNKQIDCERSVKVECSQSINNETTINAFCNSNKSTSNKNMSASLTENGQMYHNTFPASTKKMDETGFMPKSSNTMHGKMYDASVQLMPIVDDVYSTAKFKWEDAKKKSPRSSSKDASKIKKSKQSPKSVASSGSSKIRQSNLLPKVAPNPGLSKVLKSKQSPKSGSSPDSSNKVKSRQSPKDTPSHGSSKMLKSKQSSKCGPSPDSSNVLKSKQSPKCGPSPGSYNVLKSKQLPKDATSPCSSKMLKSKQSPKCGPSPGSSKVLKSKQSPKDTISPGSSKMLKSKQSPKVTSTKSSFALGTPKISTVCSIPKHIWDKVGQSEVVKKGKGTLAKMKSAVSATHMKKRLKAKIAANQNKKETKPDAHPCVQKKLTRKRILFLLKKVKCARMKEVLVKALDRLKRKTTDPYVILDLEYNEILENSGEDEDRLDTESELFKHLTQHAPSSQESPEAMMEQEAPLRTGVGEITPLLAPPMMTAVMLTPPLMTQTPPMTPPVLSRHGGLGSPPFPYIWHYYKDIAEESNSFQRIVFVIRDMRMDIKKCAMKDPAALDRIRKKIAYGESLIKVHKASLRV